MTNIENKYSEFMGRTLAELLADHPSAKIAVDSRGDEPYFTTCDFVVGRLRLQLDNSFPDLPDEAQHILSLRIEGLPSAN